LVIEVDLILRTTEAIKLNSLRMRFV